MPTEYLQKYEVHNVGGFIHNELWVPAENLAEFNQNIVDKIQIIKVFVGEIFDSTKDDEATKLINGML